MRKFGFPRLVGSFLILLLFCASGLAQAPSAKPANGNGAHSGSTTPAGASPDVPPPANPAGPAPAPTPSRALSFDQVVQEIVEREAELLKRMRDFRPIAETYIQNMQPDIEMGAVPKKDEYFLGKLDLSQGVDTDSFLPMPGIGAQVLKIFTRLFSVDYLPRGFAQMVVIDGEGFDQKHYDFEFVRREFLGEVRAMVFNVTPKPKAGVGRFLGRIWVEDGNFNVVRFNGVYTPPPRFHHYFHFDSWRVNMGPGLWLPAYIYSEETDFKYFVKRRLRFKGQTRIWGYDLKNAGRRDEFTTLLVDAPEIKDESGTAEDMTPVSSLRAWHRQAEDNVLERLEKAGLLASDNEVNRVLETVVNNLIITNNLDIQPEPRARVLLTMPFESFTIGHTIVLSRGLVDVLPDEASLAMVLAHELAHIKLGHALDTKFAFHDRMLFDDTETFRRMGFGRDPHEEQEADNTAMQFLQNSPYKDKLANAGLFLRALHYRAPVLTALIRPHLGARLADRGNVLRMTELMGAAPELELKKIEQVAALPLGARVKMDPWDASIAMAKSKPVALISAREKLIFEVTPFMPYLTRESITKDEGAQVTQQSAPAVPSPQDSDAATVAEQRPAAATPPSAPGSAPAPSSGGPNPPR